LILTWKRKEEAPGRTAGASVRKRELHFDDASCWAGHRWVKAGAEMNIRLGNSAPASMMGNNFPLDSLYDKCGKECE
jgi:hypothetical protein